jgi:hypothetical protein
MEMKSARALADQRELWSELPILSPTFALIPESSSSNQKPAPIQPAKGQHQTDRTAPSYKLPCYSKHNLYLDGSWVDSQASHLEEEAWWQESLFLTVLFMLPSKPSTPPSSNINFLYMDREIFLPMLIAVWLDYSLSSILYFILMHWIENHEAVFIFID